MMENEHIIIAVNDKEASPEHLERLQEHRGRSRSRIRGNSRSQSTSVSNFTLENLQAQVAICCLLEIKIFDDIISR